MTKYEGWLSAGIMVLLLILIVVSSNPVVYDASNPKDGSTGALEVIDYAHHEVHSGSHYNYRDHYLVVKNTNKSFLIVTPDSPKFAHMIIGIDATTSTIEGNFFENCTVTNNGTLEPARNRNRNYNNGNLVLIYEDPIISFDGNELSSGIWGAGRNSQGGGSRDTEEIVLRGNETYCLRITEQNIENTNVNVLFDWYEHEDRE